jgi:poly(3-hydroxybutyrate) depolymerase
MVATLKQRYQVDPRRIYTTGFSNGGIFSYLLWAERAKTTAAVGEVAGSLDATETLRTPRALLAIAGRRTRQIRSATRWTRSSAPARPTTRLDQARGPICTFYPSAGGNKTPVKTLIHPLAHVYPPWAPAQIVTFFKAHPQP